MDRWTDPLHKPALAVASGGARAIGLLKLTTDRHEVPERITFRLAVLAYRCQHNMAPRYLTAQLQQAAGEQRWLPAASTLVVVGHARCSSHRTRDHRWPCVQFNCSSCVEQFANCSAVFWVTGHFSTPPENWTVRAFFCKTEVVTYISAMNWDMSTKFSLLIDIDLLKKMTDTAPVKRLYCCVTHFHFPAAFCYGHNLEVC